MLVEIFLLCTAAVAIWLSTGFAVEAIEKFAGHSRLTKFTLSLFVIGVVTSFPEMAISLSSVLLQSPQIALGNLIGSQIFLLFAVIPVLSIVSKGLHLHFEMKNVSILLTLLAAGASMVVLFNQRLDLSEVLMILGIYVVFFMTFFHPRSHATHLDRTMLRVTQYQRSNVLMNLLKLAGAVLVLVLASHTAVREIIEIAAVLQTPRFLLSLLVLPIATNLPELSLAFGNLSAGKKDFAIADYMGAVTFNSVLIAVLALFNGGSIEIGQNISWVIIIFLGGLGLFWWNCYSKEVLSIKEGVVLGLLYFGLLIVAIGQIMTGIRA